METRSTGSRVCLNGADGPHDNVRKPRSTRSEFVVVKRACGFEHRDMLDNFDSGRRPKHQQALD